MSGTVVLTEKWPVLGRHEQAAVWLQIWTDLGRAPGTIDAYARGLAEYLLMCEREDHDPVTANRAHVAVFVRDLTSRPHRRGGNVVSIAVCLLDVSADKTGTAFTKPVDPILGQALDAWQAIRPGQPKFTDRRTGEHADLLFAFRARKVSSPYINNTVIPMLCRKTSVPAADVRR